MDRRDLTISLCEAELSGVDLTGADLSGANLFDAYLHGATLSELDLSNATYLRSANLRDAYLAEADGITNEELAQQAKYLRGTTMPNGQQHEEWLKDRQER